MTNIDLGDAVPPVFFALPQRNRDRALPTVLSVVIHLLSCWPLALLPRDSSQDSPPSMAVELVPELPTPTPTPTLPIPVPQPPPPLAFVPRKPAPSPARIPVVAALPPNPRSLPVPIPPIRSSSRQTQSALPKRTMLRSKRVQIP